MTDRHDDAEALPAPQTGPSGAVYFAADDGSLVNLARVEVVRVMPMTGTNPGRGWEVWAYFRQRNVMLVARKTEDEARRWLEAMGDVLRGEGVLI